MLRNPAMQLVLGRLSSQDLQLRFWKSEYRFPVDQVTVEILEQNQLHQVKHSGNRQRMEVLQSSMILTLVPAERLRN
jgi:hypothetical protein